VSNATETQPPVVLVSFGRRSADAARRSRSRVATLIRVDPDSSRVRIPRTGSVGGWRYVDVVAVADRDGVNHDGLATACGACCEVEVAVVKRADHGVVADDPVSERPAAVRADSVDRIPSCWGVEECDAATVNDDLAALTERNVIDAADKSHRAVDAMRLGQGRGRRRHGSQVAQIAASANLLAGRQPIGTTGSSSRSGAGCSVDGVVVVLMAAADWWSPRGRWAVA